MAIEHLQSGQCVSVRPLGDQLHNAKTTALLKADQLEIVRIVLQAGKGMREHAAPGEITIQCIEGCMELRTPDAMHLLNPGDFVHLRAGAPHSLMARSDTSALVTMVIGAAR